MRGAAVLLGVAAAVACVLADDPDASQPHHHHHHHHREHKEPLEMETSDIFEKLGANEHLQIAPAESTMSLSDAGPLTRADYGGEKPYETREIVEDGSNQEMEVGDADASRFQETNVPNTDVAVDVENTVPRLLSDGRLVRVPIAGAPAGTPVTEVKVSNPEKIQVEDIADEELSAPDNADHITFSKPQRPAAPKPSRIEDVDALELGEGVEAQAQGCSPNDPTCVNPTFEVNPKVRVSSLVGGILSSVLSSVLTRGMNFASADLKSE